MPKRNVPWQRLYDGIQVIHDPKRASVPPVTNEDLERVESDLAFRLPESYRAFMIQFGPGDLVGHWILPLLPKQTRPRETLTEVTKEYREASQKYPDDFANPAWHLGVVLFANCGPHGFAWHSADESSKAHESRVYDLCSEEEQQPLVIADSFWEFVLKVEEGSHNPRNPFRHGEGGLNFRPATLVGKK